MKKDFRCPECGNNNFHRAGTYPTRRWVMGKLQCNNCGRILSFKLKKQEV